MRTIVVGDIHGCFRDHPFLAYIRTLPLYYETEHYICVHAAVSRKGPECTDRSIALWDRSLADEGIYCGKLVIYGHTPMEKASR